MINISINTDNAAFEDVAVDGMNHELPRILEALANYITKYNRLPPAIFDINGNKVGTITESV
jgi:hypothetical protein